MKEILDIVLQNLLLLYVPAVEFLLSLLVLRIKRCYVKDGVLLRRSPVSSRVHPSTVSYPRPRHAFRKSN